jgi:hypothetical protein
MSSPIIDAHAHCGRQHRHPPQDYGDYLSHIRGTDIEGVVMFPPVMEIYDRYDYFFEDTPEWRERRQDANEYLLALGNESFQVFPYLFVWNDFAVEQLTPEHCGIKWHRHSSEPQYDYDSPKCSTAIEAIQRRNMPICFEEELENTLWFINELAPRIRVIIPHCGFLNGGYETLRELNVWENPMIYTDTSLVQRDVVLDYLNRYGDNRIMFGSDFPFGDPKEELHKILKLPIGDESRKKLLGLNLKSLLSTINI